MIVWAIKDTKKEKESDFYYYAGKNGSFTLFDELVRAKFFDSETDAMNEDAGFNLYCKPVKVKIEEVEE